MNSEVTQQITLLSIVFGVVTAINLLLLGLWGWRRLFGNRPTFARTWSFVDLWLSVQIIVIGLVLMTITLIPIALWAHIPLDTFTSPKELASPRVIADILLPSVIGQNMICFLVPAAFLFLKYDLPLRAIGLTKLPSRRDITAGLLLGMLGMTVSAGIEAGVSAIASHFTGIPWVRQEMAIDQNNPVADITKALPHLGAVGVALGVLAVGLSAPLGEEMLFRGWAFNSIRRRLGLPAGLILSALLFTLPHSYGLGLIPVFALGLLLAWTYRNSGSLWVPIILHATNNTIQVLRQRLCPAACGVGTFYRGVQRASLWLRAGFMPRPQDRRALWRNCEAMESQAAVDLPVSFHNLSNSVFS